MPSLTILGKQYQRRGSFDAPRLVVALPVRMPGTPIRPSETNRLAGVGESGCQAPPRDAPSESASGRDGALKSVNRSELRGPLPWPLMTVATRCPQPLSLNAAAARWAWTRTRTRVRKEPHLTFSRMNLTFNVEPSTLNFRTGWGFEAPRCPGPAGQDRRGGSV